MRRLIDFQIAADGPRSVRLRVGDVLSLAATGASVEAGGAAVELLGPLGPAVVATDGEVLSPAGPPNAVLLVARAAGRARVVVVAGDPWGAARTMTLDLIVEN